MELNEFTKMYNKGFYLNNTYIEGKQDLSENSANEWLSKIENDQFLNKGTFDLINYEKLIYFYVNFYSVESIRNRITNILNKIAHNYSEKEKYKMKLL